MFQSVKHRLKEHCKTYQNQNTKHNQNEFCWYFVGFKYEWAISQKLKWSYEDPQGSIKKVWSNGSSKIINVGMNIKASVKVILQFRQLLT